MRREVLEFEFDGTTCFGTRHRPADDAPSHEHSTAWVSFNFGQAPRSGHGDLAVKLADLAAAQGVPALRFDSPGLGDSDGELPLREDHYWQAIESGAHAPFGVALLEHLQQAYGYERFVLSGLCGGAVTAIRVGSAHAERCLGLVLLEPSFLVTRTPEELRQARATATKELDRDLGKLGSLMRSPRSWLNVLRGKSKFRHHLSVLGKAFRRKLQEMSDHGSLPPDSNLETIATWAETLEKGMPSLVLSADRGPLQAQLHRVMDRALSPAQCGRVAQETLPHTNHTFGTGFVHERILFATRTWLSRRLHSEQ
jgi:pimeloyl-ACP methyl ester carboxylesterase